MAISLLNIGLDIIFHLHQLIHLHYISKDIILQHSINKQQDYLESKGLEDQLLNLCLKGYQQVLLIIYLIILKCVQFRQIKLLLKLQHKWLKNMITRNSHIEDLESIIKWPLITSLKILTGLAHKQHKIFGIQSLISIEIDIHVLISQEPIQFQVYPLMKDLIELSRTFNMSGILNIEVVKDLLDYYYYLIN